MFRVKPQLTFPLMLLLLLQLQLAKCQYKLDKTELPRSPIDKQQDTDATIGNADWLSARRAEDTVTGNGPRLYPEEDNRRDKPSKADTKQKEKFSKSKEAKRRAEKELAAVKSKIMQDFAREHGETIRRSRRHANLFDGSGYLLDHMEELKEYQSRAEQHQQQQQQQQQQHRRKRHATDDNARTASQTSESSDFNAENLPEYSSLDELLDHLNDAKQADIVNPGLKVQFAKEKLRKKRSLADDVDEDNSNEDDNDNDNDNDWDGDRDAQASVQRLDEMLKDLAQYLDQEHLDAEEDAKDQQKKRKLFAGYNRELFGAHKTLVQLKDMLVTATASGRMSSIHVLPDETVDWEVNSETLRENVEKLRKIYRQMDEL